jgi:hypothetical protein
MQCRVSESVGLKIFYRKSPLKSDSQIFLSSSKFLILIFSPFDLNDLKLFSSVFSLSSTDSISGGNKVKSK